jgi:colanic acid biosynthesis glycosyl transferase WcaI
MKILILSQYYLPEPVPKPHELAAELVGRGHEVSVLTGQPNYPKGEIYPGYTAAQRRDEMVDGVQVHRLPLFANHSLSKSRMLNYASFVISVQWWMRRLPLQADLLYVYHPPLSLAIPARALARRLKIPYVYAVHDLWPESIEAVGIPVGARTKAIFQKLENLAYSNASRVIVANPGFAGHLEGKGVPPQKLVFLPNWADETVYYPVECDAAKRAEVGEPHQFVVLYGGNVGAAQELDVLLEAARLLRDDEQIAFAIVGDGVERERLQEAAKQLSLSRVRFLGRRPAHEMAAYYAAADVLYCGLRDQPLFRITIPSKIFSYMACAKPTIASLSGDGADLILQNNAGLVCPPGDGAALAESIKTMQQMSEAQRRRFGEDAHAAFTQKYAKTVIVDGHEKLFQEILATQMQPKTKLANGETE